MANNDQTKEILVATAQQAWDELDIQHLQHLSETMPNRVRAIIESQGWGVGPEGCKNLWHITVLQPSLNALVTWLPAGGRESVARDIVDATTDKALYDVFHNLLTGLAMPMKARTKQPSITDSPQLRRQANVEAVATTLDKPESRDPTFGDLCLRRDGNCCVATGQMNTDYWETIGCPDDIYFGPTEGAHIIPFSYASWDKSSEPPHDSASAWAVLWRCFPRVRQEGLRVDTINSLSNGITLRDSVHREFGKFSIAFKPTDDDDTYEVKVFNRFPTLERQLLPESGHMVLKKADDAQDLDLPNPALLDCHYRLAEILNASGMAEVIERNFRRWEDLKGTCNLLREDGGTDIGAFLYAGLWERVMG
ncbi:uncharacterized protein N7459_007119 [Penicillium hispanicum]|uniref:uncharacterized protein n=1 Tax=Penicillium hispanicum TaxID=1080232 RepID=UPI00253F768A|nr:uncharacterized protein N7459_007119 [Penicillium hispanicum]KAJ5578155.1 hypothetical protein N7459_007119 [Penicillium hispanicum]